MGTCGGFMTAANDLIPNIPKLDTVKVPPFSIKMQELTKIYKNFIAK